MFVIPAIDLLNGECVRLTQGDYSRREVYSGSPVDVAKQFEDQGATWLHVVDLDGAKQGTPSNLAAVELIRRSTSLKIEFGGGIRTETDLNLAWSAGADRLILGSILVRDKSQAEAWFQEHGDRLVAGIDTKNGIAATGGWINADGGDGLALAKEFVKAGCQRVIVTDIETDGALQGPNLAMMALWARELPCAVIASGGVSCLQDVVELARTGVEAVIVGKALYVDRFNLNSAFEILKNI
ncbi:1-(5-phosphoribosyl)-5-[(5-phosphoribosylamino)methylideneamino]imidazole-4-carboxamide isomerase [Kamptonema cortianum]|nr:1-(5-phosphoribosyl)-5-[(5-phosphoribosylamino)methylideneamino]imidazole-4-carboxamide isomerase [Geitlerinema splendidum]MDK3157640.1 1-(5-phosphoribosyl)-5-[(5-phosphoribosylamino)methylideneamino]imidazole-4-carboxamide isomerase [Kamptonema cortianum]